MRYLRHKDGGDAVLKNSQVLGDDSPLEFGDGVAGPVADDVARKLASMHRHVEVGRPAREEKEEKEGDDLEAKSYNELRSVASEYDEVDGSATKDEIIQQLREVR
jgi:hypothetical protein